MEREYQGIRRDGSSNPGRRAEHPRRQLQDHRRARAGTGLEAVKFRDNIAAIETVKQIVEYSADTGAGLKSAGQSALVQLADDGSLVHLVPP